MSNAAETANATPSAPAAAPAADGGRPLSRNAALAAALRECLLETGALTPADSERNPIDGGMLTIPLRQVAHFNDRILTHQLHPFQARLRPAPRPPAHPVSTPPHPLRCTGGSGRVHRLGTMRGREFWREDPTASSPLESLEEL